MHGHKRRDEIVAFVHSLGLKPIVLDAKPNRGRTIIEKLEDEGLEADFAVVAMTADDVGCTRTQFEGGGVGALIPRARPNVLIEIGYFLALLGRDSVALLHEHDVEVPSDLSGVGRVAFDSGDAWHLRLFRELREVWPDLQIP